MDLNEKMIAEIAGQLGLGGGRNPGISKAELSRLEGKSDRELEADILRLKQQLAASNIPPARQVAMLRSLMPMMDHKQRARLKKIIELIER